MYITKIFKLLFNIVLANFFMLINFTYLIKNKASTKVNNFKISFFILNYIFILLKQIKTCL